MKKVFISMLALVLMTGCSSYTKPTTDSNSQTLADDPDYSYVASTVDISSQYPDTKTKTGLLPSEDNGELLSAEGYEEYRQSLPFYEFIEAANCGLTLKEKWYDPETTEKNLEEVASRTLNECVDFVQLEESFYETNPEPLINSLFIDQKEAVTNFEEAAREVLRHIHMKEDNTAEIDRRLTKAQEEVDSTLDFIDGFIKA